MILNFLYAEYVFFERLDGDIRGIDNPIILELVKQYEFPNNINSEISDTEKEESISNEEAFIRRKLKEINPNYDLHFIPTTLMQKVVKDQGPDMGETVKKLRWEDRRRDNADRFIDQQFIDLNPKMVEIFKDYISNKKIPESLALSEVEKKVVSIEEEAHRKQEFLLYRATMPILLQPGSDLSPPMYVLDYPGRMGYEEKKRHLQERSLYHLRKMWSYGLSFNSTYFSGCTFDPGACTPYLMGACAPYLMGALYVLKIPKKEFETYLNNLIYIPNDKIHYLSELFKPQSEFHPRTKGKVSAGIPPEGVTQIEYDKVHIAKDLSPIKMETIQKYFAEQDRELIQICDALKEIIRSNTKELSYRDIPEVIKKIEEKNIGLNQSYKFLYISIPKEERAKIEAVIEGDKAFEDALDMNKSIQDIAGILYAFQHPEIVDQAINRITRENRLKNFQEIKSYQPGLLFQLAVSDMLAKYMVVLYDGEKVIENNDTDLIENQYKVVGFIRSKLMFEPTLHKIEQYAGMEPSYIKAAEQYDLRDDAR